MSSQSPQQIPQPSASKTPRRVGTQPNPICRVSDLPPGERKIVEVRGRLIGVFNVHGKYYVIRSLCPHQGAPLCRGTITGTGRSVFNPHRLRVRTYDVTVEDGWVVLHA
ncbi:MAG: Rieske 2Fe-2S domain-containing protein [Caldilineaceae bacterium]|nr:Rieske 2Fe-2S domain-containing protein [Caldilineaceae bacterium]